MVGYKKIKVRFVFDAKADGRRKGHLVAQGNMTPKPEEAMYSSIAALRSLRIIVYLAELNGLNLMQGDIGNAYLESYTQEKVYFVAGPKFGQKSGHTFIIRRLCMVYVQADSISMRNYLVYSEASTSKKSRQPRCMAS